MNPGATDQATAWSVASGPRGRGASSNQWRKRLEITFFVAPALLLFAIFVIVPVLQAGRYSVFNWNGLGPLDNFVGLQNYVQALGDEIFQRAVRNNLTIAFFSIAIQLPIGIMVALLLNRKFRGQTAMRVIVFVPYVLAEVVAGVVWVLILQPNGPLDAVLDTLGLGFIGQVWLGDPSVALWTVMGVLTWKYSGLAIVLLLAGLQGVPEELHEAASIDGATWWQVQRKITIPLLGPTIRTWIFLSLIGSLQLFDMVWILTKGGPVNATVTMATYLINQGTDRQQYGYASAVAILLFCISFILAILYQTLFLNRDAGVDKPRRKKVTR
ncbi:carbohydrate ABC transporter permease [Cellulomonas sp. S1-8]|uniref:carbohydrate ABC transporter permease n=1 Tax=Cellulomonas sp. S1-8 TaxID=2904790 RepID=UPI002244D0F0|nr:sugar ABC transporter permease [Cellulomonas sp. S1-8]UZN04518.1 sugar ABC transporter permease [Cellulomonas sp. S1-8]